jgi:hypothetical protein
MYSEAPGFGASRTTTATAKEQISMNIRMITSVFSTALLLGAYSCLTGCATTGIDRATKTTNTMQRVESDYRQASIRIDATNASLEKLITMTAGDTKKAFSDYSDNVDKMENLGKLLDKHTEKMSTQRNEYFTEWESSYTNPEIRELSEQRRIELRENYARIPEASIGVKGDLKSYLGDIRDIQKFLSNDLTPNGIETIRPIALKAVTDGDSLKESIKPVLAAIDRVKAGMIQGGTSK